MVLIEQYETTTKEVSYSHFHDIFYPPCNKSVHFCIQFAYIGALHIAVHRHEHHIKFPPITVAEFIAHKFVNTGETISLLEDAKSRMAAVEGDLDY